MSPADSSTPHAGTRLSLGELETPCLLLDEPRLTANIARLTTRLRALGRPLRPHLKTAKSIDVARRVMDSAAGPCTVSTLKEAEYFASAGVKDILYAVGIAPAKLTRVLALRARGVDLSVVLDSVEQAKAVGQASRWAGVAIPALIEIDVDDHRSGVAPDDTARLRDIAQALVHSGGQLRGVLTHAGQSYSCGTLSAIAAMAEQERRGAVAAAEALRAATFECPVVSVGSTPTAHFAGDLSGVTEVRAGVFVFFDLLMAGIGVCSIEDIALSVLSSVIGHQHRRGWTIVDAGWMALSRDRGTARLKIDQGYGLVCDVDGRAYEDFIVVEANQEHGILAMRPGSAAQAPRLAVGSLVRIFPNHACATAAQHAMYHVLREPGAVSDIWPRITGW